MTSRDRRGRGDLGSPCLGLLCLPGTQHPQDLLCPLLTGTMGQSLYPSSRGSY